MNIIYPIPWLCLYLFNKMYKRSADYINSTIHTVLIILLLSISRRHIDYVIPWSQSYFIYDCILSLYKLAKPIVINNYNKIINRPTRLTYPLSYMGYIIHHSTSLFLLSLFRHSKHHPLRPSYTEVYYYLEWSNMLIYITYFVFKIYGKDHLISLLTLYTEIIGYSYLRSIVFGQIIYNNWYMFDVSIKGCAIIIYILGITWMRLLVLQLIKSGKRIQDKLQVEPQVGLPAQPEPEAEAEAELKPQIKIE